MASLSWKRQIGVVNEVSNQFSQAFTGGLAWFGLHSGLVGFGTDRFSQLNFVLCLNVSDVLLLLCGNNAHLIILVSWLLYSEAVSLPLSKELY